MTSGQLPWIDGELKFVEKVGSDLSVEEGYQCFRLSALNVIAQLKSAVGDLSKIKRIVCLEGSVKRRSGLHPAAGSAERCIAYHQPDIRRKGAAHADDPFRSGDVPEPSDTCLCPCRSVGVRQEPFQPKPWLRCRRKKQQR
ncbi:MAG: RidA family protein [Hyphomicrobiales bacterium]|nr:RidA family protein [Hyphomicrobiales bacterium]